MAERFAVYYAPETTDPLWRSASRWLGRDAATGEAVNGVTGLEPTRRLGLTRSARRYGFHATIKAPFRLAEAGSFDQLVEAVAGFAACRRPLPIGPIALREISGFLALVPETQSGALTEFAADCVKSLDGLRAPLTAAERDKRIAQSRLDGRQIALLDQYGYPYVLEAFRFHMTITDRLADADRAEVRAAASDWFEPFIGSPLMLDRLVIYREKAGGAPFDRIEDFVLSGSD